MCYVPVVPWKIATRASEVDSHASKCVVPQCMCAMCMMVGGHRPWVLDLRHCVCDRTGALVWKWEAGAPGAWTMWRAGQRMLCVWPVQIRTAGRLAEVLQVCGPCISRGRVRGSAQEEGADWTHVCVSMSSLVGSFMELSTFELGSCIMVGVASCGRLQTLVGCCSVVALPSCVLGSWQSVERSWPSLSLSVQ